MTTKKPAKKVIPLKTLAQLKNELSLLREENMRLRFEANRGMWSSHQEIQLLIDKLGEVNYYLTCVLNPFDEFRSFSLWQRVRLFFFPMSYFADWLRAKDSARVVLNHTIRERLSRMLAASNLSKEEPPTNG